MPATYEPIASTTISSSTATASFNNIPGTYTDLVVVAQIDPASSGYWLNWRANSDSSSLYSATWLIGDGSTALSSRSSNFSSAYAGLQNSGLQNNYNNIFVMQFFSYASTSVFKTALTASASASSEVGRTVCLYRSTSAITSLTFAVGNAFPSVNMDSATFALYGIKAA